MDEKLKLLFDYQRFQKNDRLSALIEKCNRTASKELDWDTLSEVNAAGIPASTMSPKGKYTLKEGQK